MKKFLTIFVLSLLTGLCVKAQSGFDKKIAQAVKHLSCAEPGPEEPVTLNAGILSEKDSIAVMVKGTVGIRVAHLSACTFYFTLYPN